MILLCGIPSEPPLARVREQAERAGVPYVLFNQRQFDESAMEFELSGTEFRGVLQRGNQSWRLEDFRGVYTRLMDDRSLPELRGESEGSLRRCRCRALHEALTCWCELTPARVVNRSGPMGSNGSKTYQAQLICANGFAVPETLVTNDPEQVRAFYARHHKRVIYKSISGVRSIVQRLKDEDLQRLDSIRWCPTQFQAFVEGTNVRVHTVGAHVFATAIHTSATDYRYATKQGSEAELQEFKLPDPLAERCLNLAEALGLAFAGIDLKLTPQGEVYCFEVNPSPAFSYYEAHTGQPIARAVAHYLAGLD
jgi:RimK-like ATP-grasp domain